MHATRQAWIEAPHRAHDVDAFKFLRPILFEDWCILHRVFVRPRSAINVAWIRIPRRWRIRMIICDLALSDDDVMRKHSADRFMEAAANGLLRNFEVCPRPRSSCMQFLQRAFREVESRRSCVGLEVCPRAVALNSVAPLWNLPFELNFGFRRSLR